MTSISILGVIRSSIPHPPRAIHPPTGTPLCVLARSSRPQGRDERAGSCYGQSISGCRKGTLCGAHRKKREREPHGTTPAPKSPWFHGQPQPVVPRNCGYVCRAYACRRRNHLMFSNDHRPTHTFAYPTVSDGLIRTSCHAWLRNHSALQGVCGLRGDIASHGHGTTPPCPAVVPWSGGSMKRRGASVRFRVVPVRGAWFRFVFRSVFSFVRPSARCSSPSVVPFLRFLHACPGVRMRRDPLMASPFADHLRIRTSGTRAKTGWLHGGVGVLGWSGSGSGEKVHKSKRCSFIYRGKLGKSPNQGI